MPAARQAPEPFSRFTPGAWRDKLSRNSRPAAAGRSTLAMMMVMTLKKSMLRPCAVAFLVAASALLGACDSTNTQYAYPESYGNKVYQPGDKKPDSVFGAEGLDIFGQKKRGDADGGGSGIGINSFLWRASLDTISFMPIASADPFGGVIITDWYAPPESPNERFKLNVFIMGRALRADGLKIAAFRQSKDASGNWADAAMDPAVVADLENTVLTRARKMRIAAQTGATN